MNDYDTLRDTLRARLDAALTDRDGWKQWQQTWTHHESSGPGQLHTVRSLDVRWSPSGPVVHAQKDNRWGQPCDIREFTDVAEAIAWVETPRSKDTVQHRRAMAETAAYARRNDIDLDGLKGVRADSGLNGKRQHFDVVDFVAPVGRVRLTRISDHQWRIHRQRRSAVVETPADSDGMKAALRAGIEALVEDRAPVDALEASRP